MIFARPRNDKPEGVKTGGITHSGGFISYKITFSLTYGRLSIEFGGQREREREKKALTEAVVSGLARASLPMIVFNKHKQ